MFSKHPMHNFKQEYKRILLKHCKQITKEKVLFLEKINLHCIIMYYETTLI